VEKQSWVTVEVYPDRISAEATLGLLAGDGIPVYVSSDEHVPGLGTHFKVLVPADQLRRARRLLLQGEVSEAELTYLATGELPKAGEP